MYTQLLRPSSTPSWRMASRNGSDSMSPTVPPISTMQTSASLGAELDAALDLIGDVRDHLHGRAQIVAAALLGDHALVDAAGGEVAVAPGGGAHEALVVPQIQVGLGAVLR